MYFFGKIIGVFLGFKWGGFFGAIAGLILGSIADKKLYELGSVNSSFFKKKTTRQALFMQTTFAVLGHLSKSKGRVTEEDIQLANQLIAIANSLKRPFVAVKKQIFHYVR